MSLSDSEIIELHELLDRLVENNLSHDQKNRLEEWLTVSEEARQFYITYLDMSVSLGHYADESLAESADNEEISGFDKIVQFIQQWGGIAAVLVFGLYLYFILPMDEFDANISEQNHAFNADNNNLENSSNQVEQVLTTLALLTKTVGLSWSEGQTNHPEIGSALHHGPFSFSDGMAQLEFMQGATVILEGPTATELIHSNEIKMNYGRLRAHVPQVAVGFSVGLPMGKVIDLGTDFGVEVHPGGSAEVFVYRGKVKYQGLDFDGNEIIHELSSDEAIYLDAYGVLTPLDMPNGNFAGSADLANRSLENAHKRRSAWLQKSKELASDPRTLLYYGFEDHDTWSRVIRDESNHNNGAGDGAVIGCNWTEGRWPGKGALQFSKDNDRVCLNLNQKLHQATLVAWVKLDALNSEGAPLLFSKPHLPGAIGWAINSNGKVALEINTSDGVEVYESAVAFSSNKLGKWIHLATTYDAKKKWVNHYINGRSFSRERTINADKITLKNGLLGHYQAFPRRNPNISLLGSIDEFAIFSNVWEEEMVRELYEVGNPLDQVFPSNVILP